MQYHHEFQQHKMEEDESSSLDPCSNLFSMRQYVLLSRQKNIFQNWPFAEKYLRLCLNNGVSNVLPPLEARVLPETTSISSKKKTMSKEEDNDHHHTLSFESTVSNICEKIKLMTLSCNDSDNACISGINNIMNTSLVDPSKLVAPKKERSRKWRRKMKSMAEIFATAKHRTLEESDEMNELSWTADSITSEKEVEYMQGYEQVDYFEQYCCDSNKSELIDDDADCKIRLTKRRRRLKPWSNSSHKATVITKNRSRGCNRKKQEMYCPKSGFMLQDAYIC